MFALRNAALVREQIENSLNTHTPGALTPAVRQRPEQTACGVASIDALLHGGLPVGVLTEFVGPACSGRTTAVLAYAAAVTQAGGVCAWIDAADALEPESAAASGVDLERLLWVRCRTGPQTLNEDPRKLPTALPSPKGDWKPRHTGGGSPHPRSEGSDMPQAIHSLMKGHGGFYDNRVRREKKAIGTPGMPNRLLTLSSADREEQINSDRLPPRRGSNLLIATRCAESLSMRAVRSAFAGAAGKTTPSAARKPDRPWQALDQALRATDLLLQGGGFGVIVLDLGAVPPEFAWRIPLATWFRFRAACELKRISLVLLTQHPCARSSAELVVRLQAGTFEDQIKVMTGVRYQAVTERSRSYETKARVVPIRKPPQPERLGQWNSEAAWAHQR